jgi:hypothetical protein
MRDGTPSTAPDAEWRMWRIPYRYCVAGLFGEAAEWLPRSMSAPMRTVPGSDLPTHGHFVGTYAGIHGILPPHRLPAEDSLQYSEWMLEQAAGSCWVASLRSHRWSTFTRRIQYMYSYAEFYKASALPLPIMVDVSSYRVPWITYPTRKTQPISR